MKTNNNNNNEKTEKKAVKNVTIVRNTYNTVRDSQRNKHASPSHWIRVLNSRNWYGNEADVRTMRAALALIDDSATRITLDMFPRAGGCIVSMTPVRGEASQAVREFLTSGVGDMSEPNTVWFDIVAPECYDTWYDIIPPVGFQYKTSKPTRYGYTIKDDIVYKIKPVVEWNDHVVVRLLNQSARHIATVRDRENAAAAAAEKAAEKAARKAEKAARKAEKREERARKEAARAAAQSTQKKVSDLTPYEIAVAALVQTGFSRENAEIIVRSRTGIA